MGRSTSDIINDLITQGKSVRPDWSWTPKSPESDLVTVPASEFARENLLVDYVRLLTRLDGYKTLEVDTNIRNNLMEIWNLTETELDEFLYQDLDNFADIWGLTRNGGSKARGPIELVFSNNNPVTIPIGTKFISSLRRKEYLTIESVSSVTPILEDGRYIIRVFVECTVEGNDGNIVEGSVMQPVTKITNLIRAEVPVNIENGEDKESNSDFVDRIKLARISRGVGSRSYLRSLVLSDSRVYDVYLHALGDTGFDRPQGIDVWVYAQETPRAVSETVKAPSDYVLETQPLIEEDPIITSGYTLNRDSKSYSRSVEALDKVTGTYNQTISYYVDDTIRDLQMVVEDDDNYLLGGRRLVLIKKAHKVKLDFSIKLYTVFGYDVDDVKTDIQNNLLYFFVGGTTSYGETFSRKLLDQDIDKSDVLQVVTRTPGVDRVSITGSTAFKVIRNDGLYPNRDPVPIEFYEYPVLGTVTWL